MDIGYWIYCNTRKDKYLPSLLRRMINSLNYNNLIIPLEREKELLFVSPKYKANKIKWYGFRFFDCLLGVFHLRFMFYSYLPTYRHLDRDKNQEKITITIIIPILRTFFDAAVSLGRNVLIVFVIISLFFLVILI